MRAVAALLAVYTLVLASGAPLPLGTVALWVSPTPVVEADAQRFPCEACPCGCNTAEHCWSKCCCHTPAQRLTWARREGVRPPESALDAAEASGLDVSHWRPGPRRYAVRLPIAEPADEPDLDDLPPCCRAARLRAQKKQNAEAPTAKRRPASPGVALMQAAACQGLAEAWLSLGEAPLPEPVEPTAEGPVRFVVSFEAPLEESHDEGPAPPPPRRV